MTDAHRPRRRPVPEDEAEILLDIAQGYVVGPAIQEFLEKGGMARVVQFGAVAEVWPEVVGIEVSTHCHPVRLDGDELVVRADHRGWITELAFRQTAILQSIEERLGSTIVGRLKVTLSGRSGVE